MGRLGMDPDHSIQTVPAPLAEHLLDFPVFPAPFPRACIFFASRAQNAFDFPPLPQQISFFSETGTIESGLDQLRRQGRTEGASATQPADHFAGNLAGGKGVGNGHPLQCRHRRFFDQMRGISKCISGERRKHREPNNQPFFHLSRPRRSLGACCLCLSVPRCEFIPPAPFLNRGRSGRRGGVTPRRRSCRWGRGGWCPGRRSGRT